MRAVVLLVTVAACGGGGDRLGECPGPRPTISDCYVGEFFADCGGTGSEPVLGCNDQGSCLWFTGGCAPEGFVGSSCASDNVCCHDSWPFPDPGPETLGFELYALGTTPWDRVTDANVSVTLDPTLTASATTFTCTGTNPVSSYTPCEDPAPVVQVIQRSTTVIYAGPEQPFRAGWHLFVEIVDDGTGIERARVCAATYTDVPGTCNAHPPICAPAGTVTINQLPVVDVRQLVVDVDVTFANGFHVVATLVGML